MKLVMFLHFTVNVNANSVGFGRYDVEISKPMITSHDDQSSAELEVAPNTYRISGRYSSISCDFCVL